MTEMRADGGKPPSFEAEKYKSCRTSGTTRLSCLTLLAGLAATLLTGLYPAYLQNRTNGNAPAAALSSPKSSCWIFMDIDSFFCPPCLQPLLDFCRALPARVQEEQVKGILVYGPPDDKRQAEQRPLILRKKWQGFRKANDIRFPAVVDGSHFFQGLLKAGLGILLFEEEKQMLRYYSLPLKAGQLDEILGFLLK